MVKDHSINENHRIDWKNTKILDREPNYYKRMVSEAIYIKEQKCGLNLQTDINMLDKAYTDNRVIYRIVFSIPLG